MMIPIVYCDPPAVVLAESGVEVQVAVPTVVSFKLTRPIEAVQRTALPASRLTKVTVAFLISPGYASYWLAMYMGSVFGTAVMSLMVAARVTLAVVLFIEPVDASSAPV